MAENQDRIPYPVAAGVLAGVATKLPQSRVYPLQDGVWRAVWRGEPIERTFRSRGEALGYNERCDRAGYLV